MKEKRNKKSFKESDIKNAIIKRAFGYDTTEIIEEYSGDESGVKLVKRKVTTKNVPPDITALKLLLDDQPNDISNLSDEQLEIEKQRLLSLLSKNI